MLTAWSLTSLIFSSNCSSDFRIHFGFSARFSAHARLCCETLDDATEQKRRLGQNAPAGPQAASWLAAAALPRNSGRSHSSTTCLASIFITS